MKILDLKQHGLAPIGERTTDAAGNAVQRFKANLIRIGTFSHPTDGWTLDVTESQLRKWLDAGKRMIDNDVSIPFTSKHFTDDSNDTLGYVDSLAIEGDWLVAEATFVGQDAILAASRNFVSVDLDETEDGLGNSYGFVIQSVALTPRPVVTGQQRIAASINGARREANVYVMDQRATVKGMADDWVDEALALAHGVSPATQKLIERAAKDVDQLGARLTNHTVSDFEIAADALGMDSGTKLLDSLENEDELVPKLAQRIKQLQDQIEAIATNVIPAIEAKGKKPAGREAGMSGLSLDGFVYDRADHFDLSRSQVESLKRRTRELAKQMSLANRPPDDSFVDRMIQEHNERVSPTESNERRSLSTDGDDWVDTAIREQNAQVAGVI